MITNAELACVLAERFDIRPSTARLWVDHIARDPDAAPQIGPEPKPRIFTRLLNRKETP